MKILLLYYLLESHNKDTFGMPIENGFSTNIKFDSYESVASYIYELYVNTVDVQFDNQFINSIISNLSNETIPISLMSNNGNNSDSVNAKTMDNIEE